MRIGNWLIFRIPKEHRDLGDWINEGIKEEYLSPVKLPSFKDMIAELYEDLQQRKTAKIFEPLRNKFDGFDERVAKVVEKQAEIRKKLKEAK